MQNNISSRSQIECCGCSACASVCNKKAIRMIKDNYGFLYPNVDNTLCNNCGLCTKICNFQKANQDQTPYPLIFSFRLSDLNELQASQSGGAFSAFASYILSVGGVVYGAAFDELYRVHHTRITNVFDLSALRGSKYVQSDTRDVFLPIKDDLRNGKVVLFSGTPCQTSAVKQFVGDRYCQNLYLVDIICHGVPSPKVWEDYVTYISKKYGDISEIKFRDKEYGWQSHFESFIIKGKKIKRKTFRMLFYRNVMLRECCYECPFASMNHNADITIGDFWGSKDIIEMYPDNLGVSIAIVHNVKGKDLLLHTSQGNIVLERHGNDYLQRNLYAPTPSNPLKKKYKIDYETKGFLYIARKYGDVGVRNRIKELVKKLLQLIKLRP